MLTFEYTARETSSGDKVKSTVQADSEKAAAKLLADQGLAPIEIKAASAGSAVERIKGRISTKDKVLFSRQLSTLINAGLPLVQSLRTVQEQAASHQMRVVIGEVITSVEAGIALSESMKKHPKVFNNVYLSMVAAGETSGTLDESLERLATQQEKDAAIVAKVRGAMMYPAIVLLVILMVVIFMLTTVLPQVEQLYVDLKQELPFITNAMLFISNIITRFWYLILGGTGMGFYFLIQYAQTPNGKRVFDTIKMRVPLFGKLFMKMYMARFTRTGATLSAAGVPMLEMLRITGQAVNNIHIDEATQRAAEKVKTGTALSEAIGDDPNFLRLVPQMTRIGEQSGALDSMFDKTAVYYEDELDRDIKAISTIIEPALMVFLAMVAGVMVGAILIPVYGLVGQSIAL